MNSSKRAKPSKMKFRILFCGTPEFAIPSLQALAQDPDFEVAHVISQPDRPAGRGYKLQASPVKAEALKLNIPVSTPENINAPEVVSELAQMKFDAIVVVAYGQILKKAFLELCPDRCVNLHGSLLPRWRGAAPIQRSLMAGDKVSGVSLQVIVRKLDAGPVIGERSLALPASMNAFDLHHQLSKDGALLFVHDFKEFLHGKISPQPQDESKVTYAEKISKEETRMDWSKSAEEIHNHVRGLAMGPQAWSTCAGTSYKIHRSRVQEGRGESGVVLDVSKSRLLVACGDQAVEILEIQPESKKRLPIEEFLKGTSLKPGDRFV